MDDTHSLGTSLVVALATRVLDYSHSRHPGRLSLREPLSFGHWKPVSNHREDVEPSNVSGNSEINSFSMFSKAIAIKLFRLSSSCLQVGMALGYIVLTAAYYSNVFNGRNLVFMSTSLFGLDGKVYNQTAILTPDFNLDPAKLVQVGVPSGFVAFLVISLLKTIKGYTTTYAISGLAYNLGLGAAISHVFLWHWSDLKAGLYCFVVTIKSFWIHAVV